VWFSEDSETPVRRQTSAPGAGFEQTFQVTCSDKKGESISYVEYTITFASVSNGYIGFSTHSYTVYSEIIYVVLPR